MPISRDPRMDRRRRVLRDQNEAEQTSPPARSRRRIQGETDEVGPRRSAGYSQNVRNACGHRLVQLIPVRRRSYLAVLLISCLLPALLLIAHYKIYVNGSWPWFGHPMVVALDAGHPNSLATWFSSHLWLLCLGVTVLTFQLRKHKLDDYNGEYRLWFWMVATCLLASIDSTTHLSHLFGAALDRWSQPNLGWSGPAVVSATLAVLIGMLGLRLCTELKSVPTSLVFWLFGLTAWAGSAALAQPEFKIDLSDQFRYWLRCALWLGGLTAIWLAGVSYLRHVYIEAQRRFLLRGRLAASMGMPLSSRIRQSIPPMPKMPAMPSFRRTRDEAGEVEDVQRPKRNWGISGWRRNRTEADNDSQQPHQVDGGRATPAARPQTLAQTRSPSGHAASPSNATSPSNSESTRGRNNSTPSNADADNENAQAAPRRGLAGWFRRPKDDDDAVEYRKLRSEEREEARRLAHEERLQRKAAKVEARHARRNAKANPTQLNDDSESAKPRSWIPKFGRPRLPSIRVPKLGRSKAESSKSKTTDESAKSGSSWRSRFKLPSFAALRLNPPEEEGGEPNPPSMRPVQHSRPLPSTDDDDLNDESRPMSKAERKRLRRQQQNRAA
ncbi:MAG: hypothetical protein R3C53_18740 [Pirellulaceae bacterium]